jgi:hypothetical protein
MDRTNQIESSQQIRFCAHRTRPRFCYPLAPGPIAGSYVDELVRNQSQGAALMSRLGTPNLHGIDDGIDLQYRQGAVGLVRILRRREDRRNVRIKRSGPRGRCRCGCARYSRRQSASDQRSGRSGIVKSVAGTPAITKTERLRSASLLQTPRGLMCKLRQCGREYAGPAESSRGIDPSSQPLPLRSNC